jgi:hypothetical protein
VFGWPSTGPAPEANMVSSKLMAKVQPWLAVAVALSYAPLLHAAR